MLKQYDAVGNRSEVNNVFVDTYTSNSLNQYTQIHTDYNFFGFTFDMYFDWDENGNLAADDSFKYYYDCENRLTDVNYTGSDAPVISYEYDGFGRRTKKTVWETQVITNYIYDGQQVIAEYDGSGNMQRKFIYGPGIDEPVAMYLPEPTVHIDPNDIEWLVGFSDEWLCQSNCSYDEDGDDDVDFVDFAKYLDENGWHSTLTIPEPSGPTGWFYYHFDGLGSVIALSDENGDAVETYEYDVYGNVDNISSVGNPYLFTARAFDIETGLYYYRARYYSPTLGRFLQVDPIGYTDGINLYTYVGNNPASFIDPYGLCKEGGKIEWVQGGLDVIGTFDPIGVTDGINAVIYAFRGQWGNAAISGIAIFPYVGDLAKGGKYVAKGLKAVDTVNDARKATKTVGKTVLGHYPEYVKLADELGANRFTIPAKIWDEMTTAERWTANKKFLDRAVRRGDDIISATKTADMKQGYSYFHAEKSYLKRTYQIDLD